MHATFAIKMVDNYTVLFNVKDKEKNDKRNSEATEAINDMLFMVNAKISGYYNKRRGLWPASHSVHLGYSVAKITAPFKVKDECIGCRLCAKNCPSKAIVMKDGQPLWTKKKCTMCFGCVNKCPANAISYGPTTKRHGQYTFEEKIEKEEAECEK